MTPRKLRKRAVSRRSTALSIIIGVVTLVVVFLFVAVSITPAQYELSVGIVSPVTITASKNVEDTVSTNAAKEDAKAAVSPMYSIDDEITANVEQDIASFFEDMIAATQNLKDAYVDKQVQSGSYTRDRDDYLSAYDPAEVDWEKFLSEEQLSSIAAALGDKDMLGAVIYAMASMDEAKIMSMKETVRDIVAQSLDNGIQQDHLQTGKGSIQRTISSAYTDRDLSELAFMPVDQYLQSNMHYDEAATNEARLAAAGKVLPVLYIEGQTVVVSGEVITDAQLQVLEDLGVVGGKGNNYMLYIGIFLFIGLLFCVYSVYLYQFESGLLAETRKLLTLATISVIIIAISVPLARLDARIIPVFFGTMLASVLVSQRSALALNVFLAFIVGTVCSWNTGILSETMVRTLMMTIIGGSVSVFALYRPGHRASMIFAGLIAGGVNVIVVILINLIGTAEFLMETVLLDGAYALGSGLLAGVLAIGTLPIWEAIFRVSTPTKLLELSNSNHPLLKRLTIEAPGTYHHSILTANLAEAGADAIGANALLARVGAYYHDVGKLYKPQYFKENQKGENPHDKLDPRESAKIITGHLGQGLELAHKYKLPRDVQKIMVQHHGDTSVAYFLHKAQEAGLNVDKSKFKYQGSKPSTKESAVVMLADTVEAAVRSMDEPTRDEVSEMINKLIKAKYNEGQLDETPLNRRDLNTLAKAFLAVFEGALHERVKYPGQEK